MTYAKRRRTVHLICGGAWLVALCWTLLFPAVTSAHAILLRSNPPIGAVLSSAPTQVQMWFSEELNPTFTTSYVVNVNKSTVQDVTDKATHVDLGNAHIISSDAKEMDLSLKPNLPPAVYLVFYRTQSAEEGHFVSGSFVFTVAEPNGIVPTYNGSLPPSSEEVPATTGLPTQGVPTMAELLDGPTYFNFLMITLIESGVIFWMGAQLWQTFIFELTETKNQEQQTLYQQVTRRFDRLFAIPTLQMLLLANIGVLIGQALTVTGGQWLQALTPSLLTQLVAGSQFGIYWMMREIVIALALVLAMALFLFRERPRFVIAVHSWANLVLGLALLLAMALSGHAVAVNNDQVVSSVLVDWLHLLAASLWVGGMLYLATIYLPVLKGKTLTEQAAALLNMLPRYSPLAITGVIIMAVSGPSNAVAHIPSWEQLLTTAYGCTLIVKGFLVGSLLLTSAVHVFWFRPRLKKEYQKYIGAVEITQRMVQPTMLQPPSFTAQQVKILEGRVQQQTIRLTRILRWEPLMGIAVLICTGLLSIFAGTLQPGATSQPTRASVQQLQAPAKPVVTMVKTTDGLLALKLTVSPNHQGPNMFTVRALTKQGKLQTLTAVSIYATLPGMDMGTNTINLQPDGKGNFSASGDFSMPGNWELRVEIRTPDNALHEAHIEISPR